MSTINDGHLEVSDSGEEKPEEAGRDVDVTCALMLTSLFLLLLLLSS
jgi:hypothetical protein